MRGVSRDWRRLSAGANDLVGVQGGDQLGQGLAANRVDPIWREIGQGQEDEAARRHAGVWEFEVNFSDRTSQWVLDSDCHCENAIGEYLSKSATHVRTLFILCRISKKADPNSVSLGAQAHQMFEGVRGQVGLNTRIKVFQVTGSAFKQIPTAFRNVGEAARPQDRILFYRVDRLSRNIVESLSWLEELNKRGVEMFSFTENISYALNKTAFIEAVLGAQKESEMIGRRVRMGLEARRARGDTVFGSVPFGQKTIRMPDGHLEAVPNDEELAVVRRLLVPNEKASLAHQKATVAASMLNGAGGRKRGRKWNGPMVAALRHKFRNSPHLKVVEEAMAGVAAAARAEKKAGKKAVAKAAEVGFQEPPVVEIAPRPATPPAEVAQINAMFKRHWNLNSVQGACIAQRLVESAAIASSIASANEQIANHDSIVDRLSKRDALLGRPGSCGNPHAVAAQVAMVASATDSIVDRLSKRIRGDALLGRSDPDAYVQLEDVEMDDDSTPYGGLQSNPAPAAAHPMQNVIDVLRTSPVATDGMRHRLVQGVVHPPAGHVSAPAGQEQAHYKAKKNKNRK